MKKIDFYKIAIATATLGIAFGTLMMGYAAVKTLPEAAENFLKASEMAFKLQKNF